MRIRSSHGWLTGLKRRCWHRNQYPRRHNSNHHVCRVLYQSIMFYFWERWINFTRIWSSGGRTDCITSKFQYLYGVVLINWFTQKVLEVDIFTGLGGYTSVISYDHMDILDFVFESRHLTYLLFAIKLMTCSLDPILFSTHMKVSDTHGHMWARMTWRILTFEPFHSLPLKWFFFLITVWKIL